MQTDQSASLTRIACVLFTIEFICVTELTLFPLLFLLLETVLVLKDRMKLIEFFFPQKCNFLYFRPITVQALGTEDATLEFSVFKLI